jgi:hypothetical protein
MDPALIFFGRSDMAGRKQARLYVTAALDRCSFSYFKVSDDITIDQSGISKYTLKRQLTPFMPSHLREKRAFSKPTRNAI